MTKFECENCNIEMYGTLHANNEIISENNYIMGCSASEEEDEETPTLCIGYKKPEVVVHKCEICGVTRRVGVYIHDWDARSFCPTHAKDMGHVPWWDEREEII